MTIAAVIFLVAVITLYLTRDIIADIKRTLLEPLGDEGDWEITHRREISDRQETQ